ncbi:hypothetical protein OJ997_03745 [Solirubrobacter phytolaccae]|uniref:DUF7674 domain-containing protein n=1 Tax=Solirubrobacter phytolaccae TaxID=1404360 RepID=A0A9X3N479_9ACTN|nr:hypothetical protein [Solirubrobacter phytolaccae]MDA0179398.1 hypothetical protein [Solirubrobacter phytolaccae]
MASWRRTAAELLPELWVDEDDRQTPNAFFFAVLPFTRDAHRRGDDDALRRAYAFATWCEAQGDELLNAVYVSFYEHLFDAWDVHEDVVRWLSPAVIRDGWTLWHDRLEPAQLEALRALTRRTGGTGP